METMDKAIRIVGISSSPRHANSEYLLKEALRAAKEAYPQVTTEFYGFKGKKLRPCLDCKACERRKALTLTAQCVLKDDWESLVRPLVDPVPNGVIIASPVYFSDVNSELRAFMERCTSLMKPYWFPELPFEPPDFSRTVGGALADDVGVALYQVVTQVALLPTTGNFDGNWAYAVDGRKVGEGAGAGVGSPAPPLVPPLAPPLAPPLVPRPASPDHSPDEFRRNGQFEPHRQSAY